MASSTSFEAFMAKYEKLDSIEKVIFRLYSFFHGSIYDGKVYDCLKKADPQSAESIKIPARMKIYKDSLVKKGFLDRKHQCYPEYSLIIIWADGLKKS